MRYIKGSDGSDGKLSVSLLSTELDLQRRFSNSTKQMNIHEFLKPKQWVIRAFECEKCICSCSYAIKLKKTHNLNTNNFNITLKRNLTEQKLRCNGIRL